MTSSVQQLHACLEQEIHLIEQFIQILEEEAELLHSPKQTHALSENTIRKNQHAEQIAAWGDQRRSLLIAMGHPFDKSGLDAAATHPVLAPVCRTLNQKAALAREMNTANGQLISTFMAHNQLALDTLAQLANPGSLYDASGRARPGPAHSKTRIKAG